MSEMAKRRFFFSVLTAFFSTAVCLFFLRFFKAFSASLQPLLVMAISDILNRRIQARPDDDEVEEYYSESSASGQESDVDNLEDPGDLSDEQADDSDDSLEEQSDNVSLSFYRIATHISNRYMSLAVNQPRKPRK